MTFDVKAFDLLLNFQTFHAKRTIKEQSGRNQERINDETEIFSLACVDFWFFRALFEETNE